jgi:hypothetical protein
MEAVIIAVITVLITAVIIVSIYFDYRRLNNIYRKIKKITLSSKI